MSSIRGSLVYHPVSAASTSHAVPQPLQYGSNRCQASRVASLQKPTARQTVAAQTAVLDPIRVQETIETAELNPAEWLKKQLSGVMLEPAAAGLSNSGSNYPPGHYLGVYGIAQEQVSRQNSAAEGTFPAANASSQQRNDNSNGRAAALFKGSKASPGKDYISNSRPSRCNKSQQHKNRQGPDSKSNSSQSGSMGSSTSNNAAKSTNAGAGRQLAASTASISSGRSRAASSSSRVASKNSSLAGHSGSNSQVSSSSSSRRRKPARGQPSRQKQQHLMRQYASILEQAEHEHTAWLHQQELKHLQLLASGASEREVSVHLQQHDLMLQKHKSAFERRWGPPVGRTPSRLVHAVAQSGSQQQQQQQSHQQRQRMEQVVNNTEANSTTIGSSSTTTTKQHQYAALSIPDPTPQLVAASASAMQAAAEVQRYTNHSVGSTVIVDALSSDPIDTARLDELEIVFINIAMPKLVQWKLVHLLPKLANYALTRSDMNGHTCGAVFNAYALCHRLDLALATWERLVSRGVDIGPIGSSALMKACARQRDLPAALQVFDQLMRRRVTFNAYTYHCLLQLCASAGHMEEALAVYNLQRLETEAANLPNAYTYTALMRGVLVTRRVELTQQLFENMVEDGVTADARLYCIFLTAAGRAGDVSLARYLYQHMVATVELPPPQLHKRQLQQLQEERQRQHTDSRSLGSRHASDTVSSTDADKQASSSSPFVLNFEAVSSAEQHEEPAGNLLMLVNALLFAHAQVGALQGALAVYKQELLGRGLVPDAYTSTALLTAAARVSNALLDWSDVQYVVDTIQQYDIDLTTQLGTALINAYRKVRVWKGVVGGASSSTSAAADGRQQQQQEMADQYAAGQQFLEAVGAPALVDVQHVVAAALHAAQQVMQQLHNRKLATSNTYIVMLCFLLEQGQKRAFRQLLQQMQAEGIQPDSHGWERLLIAAEECGMYEEVMQANKQADQRVMRWSVRQRTAPGSPSAEAFDSCSR